MEYLEFDNQTGSFSVGDTIIGATSGATCTVSIVIQNGSDGAFFTSDRVGDFVDDETIYVASYGSELLADGAFANWTGDDLDSWTLGFTEDGSNYITESSGKCRFVSDGAYISIYQTVATSGLFYIWLLDATDLTSGSVKIDMEGAVVQCESVDTHTGVIQSSGTLFRIARYDGATDATVDNASVKLITNAALANGTIQVADDGYRVGIVWSDSVTVLPKWNYDQNASKIEQKNRTPAGRLYVAKLGDYSMFNLSVEFLTSADMSAVNSWWESGTELLFFITSDSTTEVNSVVIVSKETPISQHQKALYEYYKGTINLETY